MTPRTAYPTETVGEATHETIQGEVLSSSLPVNTARRILIEMGTAPSDGPPEILLYTGLRHRAEALYDKVKTKNEAIMHMLDEKLEAKQTETTATVEAFTARENLLDTYGRTLENFLSDVDETSFAIFRLRYTQQQFEAKAEVLNVSITNQDVKIHNHHDNLVELQTQKEQRIAALGALGWQTEVQPEDPTLEIQDHEGAMPPDDGPMFTKKELSTVEMGQIDDLNEQLLTTLGQIDKVGTDIRLAHHQKVTLMQELADTRENIVRLEKYMVSHKTTARDTLASVAKALGEINDFINRDIEDYHLNKESDVQAIKETTEKAAAIPRLETSYLTLFRQNPSHVATLAHRKEKLLPASVGSKFKASIPALPSLPRPDADFTQLNQEYYSTMYSGQQLVADILPTQRNAYTYLRQTTLDSIADEVASLEAEKQQVYQEVSGRLMLTQQAYETSKANAQEFDALNAYQVEATTKISALHDERAQCLELLREVDTEYQDQLGHLAKLHTSIKSLSAVKNAYEESAREKMKESQEKEQEGIANGDQEAIDQVLLRNEGHYTEDQDPLTATPDQFITIGPKYDEVVSQLNETEKARDLIRSAHLEKSATKSALEQTLEAKTQEIIAKNATSREHVSQERNKITDRHTNAERIMEEVTEWLAVISNRYNLPLSSPVHQTTDNAGPNTVEAKEEQDLVFKQTLGTPPVKPMNFRQALTKSAIHTVTQKLRATNRKV